MTTLLRTSHQRGLVVAAAYFLTGALAAAMFVGAPHLPFSGSPLGLMFAIAMAIAPVGLALAVTRPLIVRRSTTCCSSAEWAGSENRSGPRLPSQRS